VTRGSVELTIRPVEPADLDALVDIYLSSARHHAAIDPDWFHVPERDAVRERLERFASGTGGVDAYVGAVVDGSLVGSATIAIADKPHRGNMGRPLEVAEMGVAVLEEWRGRGIGTKLIRHLEAWAAERGVEWLILEVADANPGATRLYERLGYELDRRRLRRRLGTRDET
jgi:ribosomal protein S18 acetylase RimI-like enzyme